MISITVILYRLFWIDCDYDDVTDIVRSEGDGDGDRKNINENEKKRRGTKRARKQQRGRRVLCCDLKELLSTHATQGTDKAKSQGHRRGARRADTTVIYTEHSDDEENTHVCPGDSNDRGELRLCAGPQGIMLSLHPGEEGEEGEDPLTSKTEENMVHS